MQDEEWRPVVGFEGRYEVSDQGRVRSIAGQYAGRIVTPGPHKGGYGLLQLYRDGKRTVATVHAVVAAAFIGPRPQGMNVCHNDGTPQNNVVSNLRYDSQGSNNRDKIRHGTALRGERVHFAKLTAAQAKQIRDAKGKELQADTAARFGVTFSNVSAIQLGKSWAHV
jgi:hypothetical protein